jgi:FkbM family methyltransferase
VTDDEASDAPRIVNLRGRRFAVADDKPTFWDRAEAGRWEPETLAALEEAVSPGCTVLDIGAWVGPTVLFAAALGAARVVAVEADPRALELLRGNLAANPALAARVTVVAAAAAAGPGPVRLGAARKRGDSMSSALLAGAADAWETTAVTPAELVALAEGAGPLVVKVDIEGGEYDLLPALAGALPSRCRRLLVAFHPVLMAAAGSDGPAIKLRTRAIFDALSGFLPTLLEQAPGLPENPRDAAEKANVTVLFSR